MKYEVEGKLLDVLIVRKPNKNVYMSFKDSHTILVTANRLISEKQIKQILDKNYKYLIKMLERKELEEEKDSFFWYLGKKYIPVFNDSFKTVSFDSDFIYAKNETMLNKFYKNECIRIFSNEVNRITPYFDNIPKFTLKIRNMKTRWGVNNRGNNTITLNSELLKKDLDLLDYVIIHELCHFYEGNHSSRFWAHVYKYYPNYKEARKRLRA